MSTTKAEVALMLASLPGDASLEDIQYHLDVLASNAARTSGNFNNNAFNSSASN